HPTFLSSSSSSSSPPQHLLLHHHLHKLHLLFPTSIDQPTSPNYQHNPNFTSSTHSNQPHNPKLPLSKYPFWPNPPLPTPQLSNSILPTSIHTFLPLLKPPYNSGNYSNHLLHLQFLQDDTLSLLPAFQDDPPLRTVASIARWKEMMSKEESSRAPESSHQPSPMPVSQVTKPPSSSHRAMTHPKKKKRKTGFL
ncbi:hypothetical protein LINGRAHAP2_LOCUS35067, partial [Linum grandiflorum]